MQRTRPIRKVLAGVIGGLVSLFLVLVLASRPQWLTALPAVQGGVVALVWLMLAYRTATWRLALVGLAALAAGLVGSLRRSRLRSARPLYSASPDSDRCSAVPSSWPTTCARPRPTEGGVGVAGSDLRQLAELDRVIHEPARLLIVALLSSVREADFVFLQRETGLTKGNLSSHLARLEQAGYVRIDKGFRGKIPQTVCSLTAEGRSAFKAYRSQMKRTMGGRRA